jgi:hypothetical protein
MTDQIMTPLEQHTFYMLLFNLIFRHNDPLRLDVIEAIRKIVQNPVSTHPFSPAVLDVLRSLRSDLLNSPLPEIVLTLNQPPVRLVDDDFPK